MIACFTVGWAELFLLDIMCFATVPAFVRVCVAMWCHLWLIFILYEALFLSLLVFIVLIAFTVVPVWSPATFICAIMLSDVRQISLVLPRVGFFSLSSLSRTFVSRIPNTRRSRSISSGVIVAKSHPLAGLHSPPGSCTQRLNLYRSNGTFLRGLTIFGKLV